MSTRLRRCVLSLALILACCGPNEAPCNHDDFKVGMLRSSVLTRFGAPERKAIVVKSSVTVSGPIESFWARVPAGAKVEIWSYTSAMPQDGSSDPTRGSTELYFVDDSETVDGIGFAVEGAVY